MFAEKKITKKFQRILLTALMLILTVSGHAFAQDDVILSDDASDFVLLSEAVPDGILEIRYYSTYNFLGDRIHCFE